MIDNKLSNPLFMCSRSDIMMHASSQAVTAVGGSMADTRPVTPLCSINGIPVSPADMLSMLDGATMHNVTNLDDGQIVTLGSHPT
jgi:hypothetical protein